MPKIPFISPEKRFTWISPAVPYYLGLMAKWAVYETHQALGIGWPRSLIFFSQKKAIFYNYQNEVDEYGQRAFKLIFSRSGGLKNERREYQVIVKRLDAKADIISPGYLNKLTSQELIKLYNNYCGLFKQFWFRAILAEMVGYGAEAYLSVEINQREYGDSAAEILNILTTANDFSFFQKEEMALLKLIKNIPSRQVSELKNYQQWREFLKANPKLERKIIQHGNEYNWILNSYASCQPLPNNYFYKKSWQMLTKGQSPARQLNKIIKIAAQTEQRRKIILQSLLSNKELLLFAKNAGAAVAWHDDKKAKQLKFQRAFHYFLKEFSRRFKVDFDDLLYCLPWQIDEFLQNGHFNRRQAQKNKNFFLLYITPQNWQVLRGKKIKLLFEKYNQVGDKKTKEIKGIVACRGKQAKLQGKVKIFTSPQQAGKMKPGDILVAEMTSPDYILAIKKSGAIITDTGGLTSHAAVVSRELGIPCIVGTKIATQVLKDGDVVEVDADRGIVRRLK